MNIVEDIVIVGRHAVKEAIVSGHTINKIWIQEGIRKQQINDILKQFEAVMEDDFNTANAVTAWYDLSKLANKYVLENTTSTKVIQRFKEVYHIFSDVLGVPLEGKENDVLLDEDIEKLIEERNEARKNKDFARADEIRDMLKEQNIILEDTPQGVRFRRG